MNLSNWIKNLFKPTPPKPENSGVLLAPLRPTDYIVGASPIVYKNRLLSGNWQPYCFSKNKQWCYNNGNYIDQMSCVTHSVITAIETQEKFLTGKEVRYSRRWIAKLSGTTKQGNYLNLVADAIRSYGLVLETSYPTPDSYTWDEFYKDIPQGSLLYTEGASWLKKWNFQYEFLQVSDPNIDYHLKHSPIQIVIPGHAVRGIYSPNDWNDLYRDSYEPFDKTATTSSLQSALKPILTPKTIVARRIKFKNSPEIWHVLPDDSMERLKYFDDNIPILFADYSVDTSQIYELPANKPQFKE
jgi:hypothetical protein